MSLSCTCMTKWKAKGCGSATTCLVRSPQRWKLMRTIILYCCRKRRLQSSCILFFHFLNFRSHCLRPHAIHIRVLYTCTYEHASKHAMSLQKSVTQATWSLTLVKLLVKASLLTCVNVRLHLRVMNIGKPCQIAYFGSSQRQGCSALLTSGLPACLAYHFLPCLYRLLRCSSETCCPVRSALFDSINHAVLAARHASSTCPLRW